MVRPATPALAALLCAALLPASAAAQETPAAGSPSGTVYQIPAEQGRDEAAPRAPGGDSTAAGDPAAAGASPIRSENGLGTSGVVPGEPAAAGGDTAGDGSSGGGSGGGSGGSGGEGEAPARSGAQPAVQAVTASSGSASPARAFLLAGLAALVALALGAGARTALRPRA